MLLSILGDAAQGAGCHSTFDDIGCNEHYVLVVVVNEKAGVGVA
jgi:hypothetical protein